MDMKVEDKQLLLQDLCARLPYGVKCAFFDMYENECEGTLMAMMPHDERLLIDKCSIDYSECDILGIVPYLFPLSSMTEEQRETYDSMCAMSGFDMSEMDAAKLIDWFNKNHFDYRGLIKKGLALDCTNLNIY